MTTGMILAAFLISQGTTAPDPIRIVRRSVERSLPFLEKGGIEWIQSRKCSSCHVVTFMIWSHREALARGFKVDSKKLDEWTKWALKYSLSTKTKEGERGGGLDTMAQLLLARGAAPDSSPLAASYREISEILLGLQKPEGVWVAGGQLPSQRRPREETNQASTRWTLLALSSLGPEDEARKAAREKATKWLAGQKPGRSNESLALSALLGRSEPLWTDLLARQNEDGGWSWMSGEPSDALATGQTLYVLARTGAPGASAAIRRAWSFLVRSQGEDGSWKSPSTKPSSKDLSVVAYWGTAWATIGIVRTLPD